MTNSVKTHGSKKAVDHTLIQASSSIKSKKPSFFEQLEQLFTGPPKTDLNDHLINRYQSLSKELKSLIARINRINSFVAQNATLGQVCKEYMEKYPEYIVQIKQVDKKFNPNDLIDRVTAIEVEVIQKRALLTECEEFIMRHDEVYKCFEKHLQAALQKKPNPPNEKPICQ